ncbi:hypothetical protein ACFT1A_26370 [Rhodococcus sp. NPDC057135]|uniref:hypothetical protein n=1 Tax=Rhodococcus sp. NPDC057135 TaxID=3346028 RepID=UPI00362B732B
MQGEDAEIVERLDDPELKELLAAANGLSTVSLELLADIATKLRITADAPSYILF